MKTTYVKPQDAVKQVQRMFKKRGAKALQMAKKEVLEEKVESLKVREALKYFMTRYWHDTARPAMLSLACEAVGGDPDATVPIAVPMTLLSGAVDIHDDIIDQSKSKEGRPTVYGKFGKEVALLVGDALMFKGFNLLYKAGKKIPKDKMCKITDIINGTFFLLGDAEASELQLRSRLDITPEEYIHLAEKKAANVEAHTSIGAIMGGGTAAEVQALGNYGLALGIMLVIQDDFMDMLDNEEFLHRIRYEIPPLPVLYALKDSEINIKFQRFLQKKMTKQDAKLLSKMISQSKRTKVLDKNMNSLAQRCYAQLEQIGHPTQKLKLLVSALLAVIKLESF